MAALRSEVHPVHGPSSVGRGGPAATPPADSTASVNDDWIAEAAAALALGSVFAGRFLIGSVLGHGGYGVVYRAFDQITRNEVALKVLRGDRADPISVRRFQREATLGRELDSPHLVRIFDTGTSDGYVYLVLELLTGGTLRDRLSQGPQSLDLAIAWACDLARGLAALHERGLVHRDLKPSNVIFDELGRAKLADFGLVSWRRGELTLSVAETGLIGTATYLSPEQALGKPVGPASDLFSLGAVLFEALSGRSPFPADSVAAVLARIAQPAPRLRSVLPTAPHWLDRLLARLLEREPADRHASAAELLADLEGRRVGSRPSRQLIRQLASSRARQLAAWAAACLLAVLLISVRARDYVGTRFDHLRAVGPRLNASVQAIDRRGGVLWERRGPESFSPETATLARLARNEPPKIVANIGATGDSTPAAYGALSVLDPQTGALVHTVPTRLPEILQRRLQGIPDRYGAHAVHAIDLDRDGVDEVVASFVSITESPSFAVLWEPALDRVRTLLLAGGHMSIAGAADLDMDGAPELLFTGYNGMLCGRYPALAALRLTVPIGVIPQRPGEALTGAFTPGLGQYERGRALAATTGLAWLRLLPHGDIWFGRLGDPRLVVDTARQRLQLRYDDVQTELRFDGGSAEDVLAPDAAASIRFDAFTALERARRLADLGDWSGALGASAEARDLAARVADPPLAECAARVHAETLIGRGDFLAADHELAALTADPEALSEIAYTTAVAYQVAGQPERAADWFRRGLGPAGGNHEGRRQRIYYLEGLVLALGEMGRWAEAEEEARRYGSSFNDVQRAALLLAYSRLRGGRPPSPEAAEPLPEDPAIDTLRYIPLEVELATRGASQSLLERAQRQIDDFYEARGAVRSLVAVLLADLGRRDEALAQARQAVDELRALSTTRSVSHGLLAMAEARAAELESVAEPSAPVGRPPRRAQ